MSTFMHSARVNQVYSSVALLLVITSVLGLVTTFASVRVASAQEAANQMQCADAIGQGAVTMSVSLQGESALQPGTAVTASAAVSNGYGHAVGQLHVGAAIHVNGNLMPFDWFTVGSSIDLASGQSVEVPVTWTVPAHAPNGSYELRLFTYHGGTEALLQGALKQDAGRVAVPFTVASDSSTAAVLDTTTLTANGTNVYVGVINEFASDAGEMELAIDMVNQASDAVQKGKLTFAAYDAFYPQAENQLFSIDESVELTAGDRQTRSFSLSNNGGATEFGVPEETFDFQNVDQLLVVAEFAPESGAAPSKLPILLQRSGTDSSLNTPVPSIDTLGVMPNAGTGDIVACVTSSNHVYAPDPSTAAPYPVSYQLSVHALNDAGEPERSTTIAESSGTAVLGGGTANFAVTTPAPDATGFLVRLVTSRADTAGEGDAAVREIVYRCDTDNGCTPVGDDSRDTVFGIGMKAIVLGMQLVVLVILITVISIFFCNSYPFAMRRNQKQADNGPGTSV